MKILLGHRKTGSNEGRGMGSVSISISISISHWIRNHVSWGRISSDSVEVINNLVFICRQPVLDNVENSKIYTPHTRSGRFYRRPGAKAPCVRLILSNCTFGAYLSVRGFLLSNSEPLRQSKRLLSLLLVMHLNSNRST